MNFKTHLTQNNTTQYNGVCVNFKTRPHSATALCVIQNNTTQHNGAHASVNVNVYICVISNTHEYM